MKIIGISGYCATGKTTLSNLIASRSDEIEVIHLDEILDSTKKLLLPKKQIVEAKHGDGVILQFKDNPFNDMPNNAAQRSYSICRSTLISILVKSKLYQLSKEGYQMAIVEGASLNGLLVKFDYLIKAEAPEPLRIDRKEERDDITVNLEQLNKWDQTTRNLCRNKEAQYDRTVTNTSSLLEMDKVAKKIFEEATKEPLVKKKFVKRLSKTTT